MLNANKVDISSYFYILIYHKLEQQSYSFKINMTWLSTFIAVFTSLKLLFYLILLSSIR